MAKVLRRSWQATGELSGLPRRDRRACNYEAYVHDELTGRDIQFDGAVIADIAEAEQAIARLDAEAERLADTEALARIILRAESLASSKIEGLVIGARRLLKADLAQRLGDVSVDRLALEVLANTEAASFALTSIDVGQSIDVQTLLEVHRRLLAPTALVAHAGRLRNVQNWIGGSSYNPCSADFVPPPPDLVEPLLDDLCAFANADELPAVVQAALAHAQFETIHPFSDGNGRVGRTLIQMIFRRRGLARRVVPPVSLILGTWSKEYVAALNATRYRGRPTSSVARDGLGRWVGFFATACSRAVADALTFESQIAEIQSLWRRAASPLRRNSATDLLIDRLPGAPIVTVKTAAALIGRTEQATNEAIARLVEVGVLTQLNVGRRNRAFECVAIIDAFSAFERRLASPAAGTRLRPPARPVPSRKTTGSRALARQSDV